ncbi:M23 family metallopeptidase [Chryseobacterium caseinilyticum]|uniref:M23 family metallopeptidase n=1 Tax=Chryseobacterium caseinilyticum TaxID=2771428 RepID=A0ABR8ZCE1_9FLAO|nr:M23 family metallopeptidase [Chryseobacterium caseinilyticum]MBD8082923.1 M23 family metallopeptidase [Chryseobacterium caseinilyticum]
MKKLLILLLISQFTILFSQKNIKMYNERKGDSISFYVDNKDIYPVSLVFNGQPETENLKKPELFKTTQVIPGNAVKYRVTYFVVNDRTKGWSIRKMPGYKSYLGDITIKDYDKNYQYDLPYKKGESYLMYQGYNGTFSHQNENSLDFTMPEGTEVLAAREGMVIEVVQSNNRSCPTRDCAPFGNYISILHPDGTIAQYYHLKQNGAKVKIGDTVIKSQPIALSGNTGWSKGPHLHFNVYISNPTAEKFRTTLKTLFRTGDGSKAEFLEEKKTYLREY